MAKVSDELLKASQEASKKYGVPVSVILGFAGLETSFGTAGMGVSKNNLFGIGKTTYKNVKESVEDFCKLVTGQKDSAQSKKYGDATSKATTVYGWVDAIRDAGYNSEYTDGVYEQKIMDVIESHNLTQYDNGEISTGSTDSSFISNDNNIVWWGDMIVTIFSLLLVIGGFVFIGLAVTSNTTGKNVVDKLVKGASKNE